MTLRNWYKKFFKYPLILLLGIVLMSQMLYLYHTISYKEKELEDNILKISKVGFLGIKEKHRVMIELVLSTAISSFKADVAMLCKGNETVFIEGDLYSNCDEVLSQKSILNKIITVPVMGTDNYRFVYLIPRLSVSKEILILSLFSVILLLFIFIFSIFIKSRVEKDIVNPLIFSISGKGTVKKAIKINEISNVIHHQKEKRETEKQKIVSEALITQARQVSHDIRSPLVAISMAMKDLDQLPESTRLIFRMSVQRIQDIANNLLTKRSKDDLLSKNKEKIETTLLYSSLDEIISEKRLQFRSKAGVQIKGNLNRGLGLFSKINNPSLKRVISNMINNAIEALPDGQGTVTIHLEKKDAYSLIHIKDTGKGISPKILLKLGKEGASFGKEISKESGAGIGLHHAIQTVQKWGGDLTLDSTVGTGTTVTIKLPPCSPPNWFLSEISLIPNQTVCILDDDHEIHHTWDEKFKNYIQDNGINIIHLTTPEEVKKWFSENDYSNVTFLSDYELIGFKETGLDLIKELNISSISTLVTSHYGEEPIQSECKKIGLKILPKMMAANIKISIQENNIQKNIYEAIYIEDDKYLRMGWEKEAEKAGVKLFTIESPEKFSEIEDNLSKESSRIYIDQNYDDISSIKGINFAKELHKKGYQNLYLVTGYNADSLDCPDWLEVTGKDSPWE